MKRQTPTAGLRRNGTSMIAATPAYLPYADLQKCETRTTPGQILQDTQQEDRNDYNLREIAWVKVL